jgi:hypothetical protein
MISSEYQVSVPPHLKEFKWDGRGETLLDWRKLKNKFEDVAKNNESGATLRKGFIFLPMALLRRPRDCAPGEDTFVRT